MDFINLMKNMIDAHTHLNSQALFPNRKEHAFEFNKNWWKAIINVWADIEYNGNWIKISKEYKWDLYMKCTVWLHPYEVIIWNVTEENIEDEVNNLRKLYLDNSDYIVAIWEAWIDTHYDGDINMKLQKKLFRMQCELARDLWLPIVIHSRDDFNSTIEVLKDFSDLKIYFHCRWYGPEEINYIKWKFENLWIGFCGNITYPKAQNIRDSLAVCDINNILLETDAPYLPPQQLRWKTNYPSNIWYIYDFVANELSINKDILIQSIEKNFENLYKQYCL